MKLYSRRPRTYYKYIMEMFPLGLRVYLLNII